MKKFFIVIYAHSTKRNRSKSSSHVIKVIENDIIGHKPKKGILWGTLICQTHIQMFSINNIIILKNFSRFVNKRAVQITHPTNIVINTIIIRHKQTINCLGNIYRVKALEHIWRPSLDLFPHVVYCNILQFLRNRWCTMFIQMRLSTPSMIPKLHTFGITNHCAGALEDWMFVWWCLTLR